MTDIQNPGADGTAQGSKCVNGDRTSFFHSHRSGGYLIRSPMRCADGAVQCDRNRCSPITSTASMRIWLQTDSTIFGRR